MTLERLRERAPHLSAPTAATVVRRGSATLVGALLLGLAGAGAVCSVRLVLAVGVLALVAAVPSGWPPAETTVAVCALLLVSVVAGYAPGSLSTARVVVTALVLLAYLVVTDVVVAPAPLRVLWLGLPAVLLAAGVSVGAVVLLAVRPDRVPVALVALGVVAPIVVFLFAVPHEPSDDDLNP